MGYDSIYFIHENNTMFTIGIYFLSFIPLLKNRILTAFLHLPQKSVAYNILYNK